MRTQHVLGTCFCPVRSNMSARPQLVSLESPERVDTTEDENQATYTTATSNHEYRPTHIIGSKYPLGAGSGQGIHTKADGKGVEVKTRTVADLRAARESRTNEALKMKDEQLRILQDQNNQLLGNLDR